MENNNVTNLLYLMNGNIINDTETNQPAINYLNEVDKETVGLVKSTLGRLINKIYADFKDDNYSNVNRLIEKYQAYIKVLNDNITIDDIKISIEGNYIRLYYYGLQLCYFSLGNKKLKENEYGEGFIIWNIIGKLTCNGKTKLCKKYCYNNCKEFENVCKTKINNLIFSLMDVFVPAVNKMLLSVNRYRKTYFRIHEDGDFYNTEYFNKWLDILKVNTNVIFTAYTKEPSLLDSINLFNSYYENLTLRYSIMEDTAKHILDKVTENNIPCYIVMGSKPYKMCSEKEKREIKELENQIVNLPSTCKKSCKYCKECYKLNINRIFTTMH